MKQITLICSIIVFLFLHSKIMTVSAQTEVENECRSPEVALPIETLKEVGIPDEILDTDEFRTLWNLIAGSFVKSVDDNFQHHLNTADDITSDVLNAARVARFILNSAGNSVEVYLAITDLVLHPVNNPRKSILYKNEKSIQCLKSSSYGQSVKWNTKR